ncbi:hypothetical protein HNQ79_006255 [Streptomyces candidus]|uniref:Uncharacterized protein n=1 Tax=Streptomyces candidus TaxID=67283 RepID=A0A7X0HLM7_9ACTN|nr:hypothetical protein [Streptomyces candidus]GHH45933.1 hypothetical protein GCM10018773_36380 [Streptomyces candidus]
MYEKNTNTLISYDGNKTPKAMHKPAPKSDQNKYSYDPEVHLTLDDYLKAQG